MFKFWPLCRISNSWWVRSLQLYLRNYVWNTIWNIKSHAIEFEVILFNKLRDQITLIFSANSGTDISVKLGQSYVVKRYINIPKLPFHPLLCFDHIISSTKASTWSFRSFTWCGDEMELGDPEADTRLGRTDRDFSNISWFPISSPVVVLISRTHSPHSVRLIAIGPSLLHDLFF